MTKRHPIPPDDLKYLTEYEQDIYFRNRDEDCQYYFQILVETLTKKIRERKQASGLFQEMPKSWYELLLARFRRPADAIKKTFDDIHERRSQQIETKQTTMNDLALFREQEEFDFDAMIGDDSYYTMCGLPVKIDRIVKDVTKTTVLGISGTMTVRGIKIRGIWDAMGNIIDRKKSLCLFSPVKMLTSVDNIFSGTTDDMFRLVSVDKKKEQP